MTKASDNLFPKVILNEAATDGSDFSNPSADYRVLFLGEDGALHLKDSAGAVTDIGGGGGDVATDAIWDAAGDLAVGTGANTAGRLAAGAAGGVLAMGNSAVIWNAGTSFPGSKATGDRYWRTDLGMEFYWDGTRWLTTTLFANPASAGLNSVTTNNANVGQFGLNAPLAVYLATLYAVTYVGTTNNGSNYWTITLTKGGGGTLGSFTTAADTANTYTNHSIAVDAVTSEKLVYPDPTKTSGPGTLYPVFVLTYRLIGT